MWPLQGILAGLTKSTEHPSTASRFRVTGRGQGQDAVIVTESSML